MKILHRFCMALVIFEARLFFFLYLSPSWFAFCDLLSMSVYCVSVSRAAFYLSLWPLLHDGSHCLVTAVIAHLRVSHHGHDPSDEKKGCLCSSISPTPL